MRYISVYRNAKGLRTILNLLLGLALLVPLISILFVVIVITSLGKSIPIPPQVYLALGMMMAVGIFVFFLARTMFRRLWALEVEITSEGIHHLAPGNERTIRWPDVTGIRIVRYGKGQTALQLQIPSGRYILSQTLVPDSPDAPRLKFIMPRYVWIYPDGHEEPYDLEHGFGYKIVQQFRPDLLTK